MLTSETLQEVLEELGRGFVEGRLDREEVYDLFQDYIQAAKQQEKRERRPSSRLPEGYEVVSSCSFTVQGKPGVKGRAQWSSRNNRMMNPAKNRYIEEAIRDQVVKQVPERLKGILPWHGPVVLNCCFYFSLKKSRSGVHVARPDLDNAIKSVCDSLNDILWEDDSQVFDVHGRKLYHPTVAKTTLQVFFLEKSNGIS